MSNEIKVGLLAIVATALAFWGYKFIMGNNVLLKSNTYKVYYNGVDGLQVGTTVYISGVEVGSVANIRLLPDDADKVEVVLDLDSDLRLPRETLAVIVSTGFMGGKAVNLEYDNPCTGEGCLERGATLRGETRGLLGSLVGTPGQVAEYTDPLKESLQEVLTSQIGEDSDTPLGRSIRELESVLTNLTATTTRLNSLLANSSGSISGTLENLESLTGELEKNRDKISSIIAGTESFTSQLDEIDLKKTLDEVNTTVTSLQTTLQSTDEAVSGVSTAIGRINDGEGTLGKLMQDEDLYDNLNTLSNRADSLFNDLQERPYRYIPFKGRNKVKRFDRKDAREDEM